MVRRTNIVSTRPSAPRKKSSGGLFPKKMFREFLTRDGRKNGITKVFIVVCGLKCSKEWASDSYFYFQVCLGVHQRHGRKDCRENHHQNQV